jgi:hypothetical protein
MELGVQLLFKLRLYATDYRDDANLLLVAADVRVTSGRGNTLTRWMGP